MSDKMKSITIFGLLNNQCEVSVAGDNVQIILKDIRYCTIRELLRLSIKSCHGTTLNNKSDGAILFNAQFKLSQPYTPEYIMTGCKGSTTSVIRDSMHGTIAKRTNSTKQSGATSSLKPKQYTTSETTEGLRFKWFLSLCNSLKGGLQGDRNFFCLTSANSFTLESHKNLAI